jgi:hypothetical protein
MPDYSDLLDFLAKNPPQIECERQLHASLLELMAQCLRSESACEQLGDNGVEPLEVKTTERHIHRVRFN